MSIHFVVIDWGQKWRKEENSKREQDTEDDRGGKHMERIG